MVPAGLFGRPRTCKLPRKNPETKNVWFQAFLIWHPHHVPAVDDAVGTNTPAAQNRNGTTRLVLSIAQCRTHEANLDLKIAEMPACGRAIDAKSVRLRIRAENVPHASRTTTIPRYTSSTRVSVVLIRIRAPDHVLKRPRAGGPRRACSRRSRFGRPAAAVPTKLRRFLAGIVRTGCR